MNHKFVLLTGILILLAVNIAIYQKEQLLLSGQRIFLEIAPVDPRSLMQGDYMALDFAIGRNIRQAVIASGNHNLSPNKGLALVSIDKNKVATFKRLFSGSVNKPAKLTLSDNELVIQYRIRKNRIKLGTNAFFFQEGSAKIYDKAVYALFIVSDKGEMLLKDLYDKQRNKLIPDAH